jgi:hypothetical protein
LQPPHAKAAQLVSTLNQHGDGFEVDADDSHTAARRGRRRLSGVPIKAIALRAVWDVSRGASRCTHHRHRRRVDRARTAAEMLLAGAHRGGVGNRDLPRSARAAADHRGTANVVR